MNQIMSKYHQIGRNLMPAIAYGDSAGLPYEKGPALPEGSITGLTPVSNDYLGEFPAGTWSDDTQLSLAVIESLLACEQFDLSDQADMHVLALRHSLGELATTDWAPPMVSSERALGWGEGSNVNSAYRLMSGIEPTESGEPDGAGNGVLMKLAPLAYWQLARGTVTSQAEAEITALTQMTHRAPEATVASLVHADVLKGFMLSGTGPWVHSQKVLREVIEQSVAQAAIYEAQTGAEPVTSSLLSELVDVRRSQGNALEPGMITSLAPEGGFYAPETLVMAYGSFLRESTFPQSVYRAVELGGDTDSVASIVASMSVCAYGSVKRPEDSVLLHDLPRLITVSRCLAQSALYDTRV